VHEDRRRGREYYQVNLDTGRIFWIAFILGLVLIAVFVFGILLGGGEKEGFYDRITGLKILHRGGGEEIAPQEETGSKEPDILDLFGDGLDVETRYIDVGSLEEAAAASEKGSASAGGTEGHEDVSTENRSKEEGKTAVQKESAPLKKTSPQASPVQTGPFYYIQVASFAKRENADRFAATLKDSLYKVAIEEKVIEGTPYYRVRVGPFDSRSVAVNTMTAMKRRFNLSEPFVLEKSS
jgi:hypothetical protein